MCSDMLLMTSNTVRQEKKSEEPTENEESNVHYIFKIKRIIKIKCKISQVKLISTTWD